MNYSLLIQQAKILVEKFDSEFSILYNTEEIDTVRLMRIVRLLDKARNRLRRRLEKSGKEFALLFCEY